MKNLKENQNWDKWSGKVVMWEIIYSKMSKESLT